MSFIYAQKTMSISCPIDFIGHLQLGNPMHVDSATATGFLKTLSTLHFITFHYIGLCCVRLYHVELSCITLY